MFLLSHRIVVRMDDQEVEMEVMVLRAAMIQQCAALSMDHAEPWSHARQPPVKRS